MASIDLEEKNLKKRLEELEKKYNESLFKESELPLPELPESSPYEKPEEIPLPELPESSPYEKPESYKQPENEIKKLEIPKKISLGIFKKPKFVEESLEEDKEAIKQTNKEKVQLNFKSPLDNRELSGKINPIEIKKTAEKIQKIKKEISKVLVGQGEIVDGLIRGLLCNSHVLLEGVPGIAKTLAIRALASASGCSVKRIQFTVDMLPTDIIGITSYTPEKGFEVIKGPIFANFLIADEINRAPPKTQSALIEGMQEKQVTIGKESFPLPNPFFVMATENPIENAGVYPLPEAQVDRFLFKLIMGYPESEEEKEIMGSNITIQKFEQFDLKPVVNPKEIIIMQELVKKVYIDNNVKNYILAIIRKTREKDFENAQYISYGCSPRASIGLFIASKANALMEGRDYVLPEDVKKIVFDVMRHRLILSYKASIQKISSDLIIKEILNSISIE
jgi:MoxR-like ATPase